MTAGILLDPLPAPVQCIAGQSDDVEGVHHRHGLRNLFRVSGFGAGEPVHRDGLDPVSELLALSVEPGREHFLRAARDHVQESLGPGAVADRGEVDDHGDVLAAAACVGPDMLADADHADSVKPFRVVDQQLAAGLEDGAVRGVPGAAEVRGDPRDRHPDDDHAPQRPVDRVPGQLSARDHCLRCVLPPHGAAVTAAVSPHFDLQHHRSPTNRDVHERPGHGAARNPAWPQRWHH